MLSDLIPEETRLAASRASWPLCSGQRTSASRPLLPWPNECNTDWAPTV